MYICSCVPVHIHARLLQSEVSQSAVSQSTAPLNSCFACFSRYLKCSRAFLSFSSCVNTSYIEFVYVIWNFL